jgi:hypothetical protein
MLTRLPPSELHRRYCANRNVKAALFWTAANCWITYLIWRPLAAEHPTSQTDFDTFLLFRDLFFYSFASVFLVYCAVGVLRCLRERIVLGVWAISLGVGVLGRLMPDVVESATAEIKTVRLILWLLASLMSLSMLHTAIQARRGQEVR